MTDKSNDQGGLAAEQAQAAAVDPVTGETQKTELDLLKERADDMGIKYHPNIRDVDKLRQKVNAALTGGTPGDDDDDDADQSDAGDEQAEAAPAMTREMAEAKRRKEIRDRELRLIRVRITNLNPAKADLPGEMFCVANRIIGIQKKVIPYNEAGEVYHIPYCIFKQLKARKFLQLKSRFNRQTQQIETTQRMVSEFALEELEPLTEEELAKLAAQQRASGSVNEE